MSELDAIRLVDEATLTGKTTVCYDLNASCSHLRKRFDVVHVRSSFSIVVALFRTCCGFFDSFRGYLRCVNMIILFLFL